ASNFRFSCVLSTSTALDMEFTGLHSTCLQNNEPSLFDSPAERYLKARRSVQRFTLVQLGKCCSDTERDANTRYVVHPYNFFLFPSTLGVRDVELTLSASSIQFLSHYGFDYNKFLKDGIPYMNEVQEKNLRQHLLAGSWKVCLSAPLKLLLQSVIGYHVLEVQLVLRQALQNIPTDCSFQLMVKKVSPEHRQLLENSSYDRCQKKLILLAARGFTNLFQILVNAKKPLVGHNMLMDLMHLHDKFYRPLPESYEEFKRNIHNLFPVIIDTKTVTKSMQKVRCTAEKKSPHEAGYDAFLCGSGKMLLKNSFRIYLMLKYILMPLKYFQIQTCLNIFQNLSGEDAPCHRPPALVVHVRGWPGLNERQIYQEFKARCRFDVRRLSKNQFILLSNKYKHVRLVLRDYRHHPHLQVSVYRHWRHSPSVNWEKLSFRVGGPGIAAACHVFAVSSCQPLGATRGSEGGLLADCWAFSPGPMDFNLDNG
uniref:PARN like, ribonuclease domain containing 1 n=1 Tax=Malurus cyaneus samueli TaxID=2593467 RepID=A0A8C5TVV1_9PASS